MRGFEGESERGSKRVKKKQGLEGRERAKMKSKPH